MALGGSCSPLPEPPRETQSNTFASNSNYSTVKNPVNDQNEPSAETRALRLLREAGFTAIQQLDWIGKEETGQWAVFEIKDKELFEPGPNFPNWGAGLDKRQLWLRMQLFNDLGWRTYLLVFVKGTDDIYGAYLDELEKKGGYYDTPKRIRIYPITSFTKWDSNHLTGNTEINNEVGKNGS